MSTASLLQAMSWTLLLAISAGCAGLLPAKVETARDRDVPPLPGMLQAVQTYKASDPDASFTSVLQRPRR